MIYRSNRATLWSKAAVTLVRNIEWERRLHNRSSHSIVRVQVFGGPRERAVSTSRDQSPACVESTVNA
jgi:hypothetical protein